MHLILRLKVDLWLVHCGGTTDAPPKTNCGQAKLPLPTCERSTGGRRMGQAGAAQTASGEPVESSGLVPGLWEG